MRPDNHSDSPPRGNCRSERAHDAIYWAYATKLVFNNNWVAKPVGS